MWREGVALAKGGLRRREQSNSQNEPGMSAEINEIPKCGGRLWRLAKGAETTRTIKIRKTNLECPLKSVRYQNAEGGSGDGCNLLEPMIQATSSMFPKEF